jgi:hypothetical protein
MLGFVLFILSRTMYSNFIGIDFLGLFLVALPTFLWIYLVVSKKLTKLIEKVPPGKYLILFLRRDGEIIPVYGSKPYTGESFIDVPKLGLIHDLGKGSVCRWGMNSLRFAIENVNHTPNPRYVNFSSFLYDLGFDNYSEVKAAVQGNNGYNDLKEDVKEALPYYQTIPQDIVADEILDLPDKKIVKEKPVESKVDKLLKRIAK